MLPALRQAFNGRSDDDRLDRVFGPWPRPTILTLVAMGLVAGYALQSALGSIGGIVYLNVSAVLLGTAYALLYRQYLFSDPLADEDDFPWLAGALIPAAIALVLVEFCGRLLDGTGSLVGAPAWTSIGGVLDAFADSLGVAAGLTIAVAALCYSKAWPDALGALVKRLIIFKIMVWIMVLVFVEIGIVGAIVGRFVEGVLGIDVPDWLGDFVDQLTYAVLISTIYLAIIGGTWTACRRAFPKLLAEGDVDVLQELETMAEVPEKRREKARKARAERAASDD